MLYENIIEYCRRASEILCLLAALLAVGVFGHKVWTEFWKRHTRRIAGSVQKIVEQLAARSIPNDVAIDDLRRLGWRVVESTLLQTATEPVYASSCSSLLEQLGARKKWAGIVKHGRVFRFLGWCRPLWGSAIVAAERSSAVYKLGLLGSPTIVQDIAVAMSDCSANVRLTAIHALVRSQSMEAIPVLYRELCHSVRGLSPLAPRFLGGALAQFTQRHLSLFREGMSHADRRVRFQMIDAIRQICAREVGEMRLSPCIPDHIQHFLVNGAALDSAEEVRARAAAVLAYVPHEGTCAVLQRLMHDESKYVRMFACRAAAAHRQLVSELACCTSDRFVLARARRCC